MELAQISLRTSREQVERVKVYAKTNNLSVNTFLINLIDNALNGMEAGGKDGELTSMVAEPIKALSRLHHKLSDPWDQNEPVQLSHAERDFLIDAARKQLDGKQLSGPFYQAAREKLVNALLEDDPAFFRMLFGFAHRHYIKDDVSRRAFAVEHAPIGIPSTKYSFTVGTKTFTVFIQGNEGNLIDTPEENRPPALTFMCETDQFDTRHDWDTFIALVRLMDAVYVGKASECHSGTYTRLSRRMDAVMPWSLFLGRLQLLINNDELQEIAKEFNRLVKGDAANIIKHMRLLCGEGQ